MSTLRSSFWSRVKQALSDYYFYDLWAADLLCLSRIARFRPQPALASVLLPLVSPGQLLILTLTARIREFRPHRFDRVITAL